MTSVTSATPGVIAVPGASDALSARLAEGLEAVERVIVERTRHEDDFITEANLHLAQAGGKRFRPMLTMLVAELGEGINDDVMDEAEIRRGAPSANAKYDNSTAILVGDLLFGSASDIIADLGPEAVKIQAQTFIRLCAGQIRDDRPCPEGKDAREYYRSVLADKTGVLVATAARYGAMFGGCSPEVVAIATEYGERLGVAFQLADDLIDIASLSGETGKTPGTDLREGKRTLPVLNALASDDPADEELQTLLLSDLRDDASLVRALELLRPHPAMVAAREETLAVAQGAKDVLAPLPDSDAKNALLALAESVVNRAG